MSAETNLSPSLRPGSILWDVRAGEPHVVTAINNGSVSLLGPGGVGYGISLHGIAYGVAYKPTSWWIEDRPSVTAGCTSVSLWSREATRQLQSQIVVDNDKADQAYEHLLMFCKPFVQREIQKGNFEAAVKKMNDAGFAFTWMRDTGWRVDPLSERAEAGADVRGIYVGIDQGARPSDTAVVVARAVAPGGATTVMFEEQVREGHVYAQLTRAWRAADQFVRRFAAPMIAAAEMLIPSSDGAGTRVETPETQRIPRKGEHWTEKDPKPLRSQAVAVIDDVIIAGENMVPHVDYRLLHHKWEGAQFRRPLYEFCAHYDPPDLPAQATHDADSFTLKDIREAVAKLAEDYAKPPQFLSPPDLLPDVRDAVSALARRSMEIDVERKTAAGSPLRRWLRAERAADEASRLIDERRSLLSPETAQALFDHSCQPWAALRMPHVPPPAFRQLRGAAARRPCPVCGKYIAAPECPVHAEVRALLTEDELVGRPA